MPSVDELRRMAIDCARRGDHGPTAIGINEAIVAAVPADEHSWTRLARCYLTAGDFSRSTAACERALALNPSNTIAANLLREAAKGRLSRAPRTDGFDEAAFDALGRQPVAEAHTLLTPRLEPVLLGLNDTATAQRIVATRQSDGGQRQKLFRRDSSHWTPGHVYAFHYGGRWEPQFTVGVFSQVTFGSNCIRAGLGFNLTQHGLSRDPVTGQQQVLAFYRTFQRAVGGRWRGFLIDWMKTHAGAIQRRDEPPRADWAPERQVEWLSAVADPIEQERIFVGRWWHLPADRETLTDPRRLTRAVDDTFRDLLPLWTDVWNNTD
ncbi:MAG: tetratricopeptide repeat protein [Vicinamibacterales bacterium]